MSGLVLLSALFVILSRHYPPAGKKWAYTAVGTILGFWLNFVSRQKRGKTASGNP